MCSNAGADPFKFPVTTFYGKRDRRVKEEMVKGWARFTTGAFECLEIDGHHLWPLVKESKIAWLNAIVDKVLKLA